VALGPFPVVLCDVFTDRPLAGNQLAVFPEGEAVPEELMQPIAREINFSETVFALPPSGDGDVRIRIFTPASELPFAGHPVLGSAVVLADGNATPAITLETGRGPVRVELGPPGGSSRFARMRQPVPAVSPHRDPGPILAALGTGPSLLPAEIYDNGIRHAPVVLADPDAVAAVVPDMGALARAILAEPGGSMCVAVLAGAGRRWKARVFAPAAGVPEDPATGSTAGALVCHLARHHAVAFGDEIEISQGAEIGRPSLLLAKAEGAPQRIEAVEVGGSTVVVARGAFTLP